jgi:hypothetical protein
MLSYLHIFNIIGLEIVGYVATSLTETKILMELCPRLDLILIVLDSNRIEPLHMKFYRVDSSGMTDAIEFTNRLGPLSLEDFQALFRDNHAFFYCHDCIETDSGKSFSYFFLKCLTSRKYVQYLK